MDPIKYLFEKPTLSSIMAIFFFLLSEFDMTYVSWKSIKGQVIAEYVVDNPLTDEDWEEADFPDELVSGIE